MYNETIIYYSKNHPNKGVLNDYNVEFWEENRTCGDDLKVYIKIKDDKIKDWSFSGDTAIITTACASIFGESIVGKDIKEILPLNYNYIEELIGMPISDRRKQASVLALLTTRNAIHKYLNDGKKDTFDDVIKDNVNVC
ncbi:MAG: iron-sulfur cluster assembly scaffold protein [Candidatus Gracilibacteria bacterium]|nr:iron-sulfur cluster assembly scaffold protein [Candidatus Gracilibacteria bacterium]